MYSGGSPSGVRQPPRLLTRRMKNSGRWTLFFRPALMRRNGRISSTLAPVVPITLASRAPSARMPALLSGVGRRSRHTTTPPATVYSEPSMMMNEAYLASSWTSGDSVSSPVASCR